MLLLTSLPIPQKLNFALFDRLITQYGKTTWSFHALWLGKVPYTYSGITHQPQHSHSFDAVARLLEKQLGLDSGYFDCCLANKFPKNKGLGYHSDAESIFLERNKDVGYIAVVTLGASATITVRNNSTREVLKPILASNNTVYVMPNGAFQRTHQHKVGLASGVRISLTFRHLSV